MKTIKTIILILTLCGLNQIAKAQCPGNKILMNDRRCCVKGGCHTKCVPSGQVQQYLNMGWVYGTCSCGPCASNPAIEKQEPDNQLALSSCICSIVGYGCRDLDFKCRQHCYKVCSHHVQVENQDGVIEGVVYNTATVSFAVEGQEKITLKVYDAEGQLVKVLADKIFNEGTYSFLWNPKDVDLTAGVYAMTLTAGTICETQKIIVAD